MRACLAGGRASIVKRVGFRLFEWLTSDELQNGVVGHDRNITVPSSGDKCTSQYAVNRVVTLVNHTLVGLYSFIFIQVAGLSSTLVVSSPQ